MPPSQTVIAGSFSVVYANIIDFHAWEQWSPWGKLDPAMKTTYSGAAQGKTVVCEWTGNSDVGQGRMGIIDIMADKRVAIDQRFSEPFEAKKNHRV